MYKKKKCRSNIGNLKNGYNFLGTFNEILSDFKEHSYAKHHIGQTLSGQPAHEVLIGQHIFTKIPLPHCDHMHPIICGITHQQSKQYAR